jgi:hypothetical protein
VDRILYEVMHEGGDSRVKNKRNKEEKPKTQLMARAPRKREV